MTGGIKTCNDQCIVSKQVSKYNQQKKYKYFNIRFRFVWITKT